MAAPARKYLDPVTMENATIRFRNFAGNEGRFNAAGKRNFAVLLPDDLAELMKNDGWNVKYLKAREEGDSDQPYVQVEVNFRGPRPPRIVMITSGGRRTLDEDRVEILDWADIRNVDLILNPYSWELPSGATGVKAYLQSLYVTIQEDELERKYADVPDSAQNTLVDDFAG